MNTTQLSKLLSKEFQIELPDKVSYEELQSRLETYINQLIKDDFEKLVTYLYRIDVNEQKLKLLLHQFPEEDAGKIIAALIIERQQQKIKTRELFREQGDDIEGEEKWYAYYSCN